MKRGSLSLIFSWLEMAWDATAAKISANFVMGGLWSGAQHQRVKNHYYNTSFLHRQGYVTITILYDKAERHYSGKRINPYCDNLISQFAGFFSSSGVILIPTVGDRVFSQAK